MWNSNPHFLLGRQVCYPLTSISQIDVERIELPSPRRKRGILPLDHTSLSLYQDLNLNPLFTRQECLPLTPYRQQGYQDSNLGIWIQSPTFLSTKLQPYGPHFWGCTRLLEVTARWHTPCLSEDNASIENRTQISYETGRSNKTIILLKHKLKKNGLGLDLNQDLRKGILKNQKTENLLLGRISKSIYYIEMCSDAKYKSLNHIYVCKNY